EGCTPGFWQGGTGAELWNTSSDPDWESHCGQGTANPFKHKTLFNDFFTSHPDLNGLEMFDLVKEGGGTMAEKAARALVAAYLNASCNEIGYPFTQNELKTMWSNAVATNTDDAFEDLKNKLEEANNLGCPL
ncbi:MAG: hypothetical protein ABEN55_10445, partial [Bradymonadaceae bacterium]